MQRLALFDLDNTLLDLDAAFLLWAEEFSSAHGLGPDATTLLIALDRDGPPHREAFFVQVRERFGLSASVSDLWAEYRRLRTVGWKVAIVTNGPADNQLGKIRQTGLIDAVDVVDGYADPAWKASANQTPASSSSPPSAAAAAGWSATTSPRTSRERRRPGCGRSGWTTVRAWAMRVGELGGSRSSSLSLRHTV